MSDTDTLTVEFLNGIDALLLAPVYSPYDIPIESFSPSEQDALSQWVADGGRLLVVGDNSSYYTASVSMIAPFGPTWDECFDAGIRAGVVIDQDSCPEITDGPFGVATNFRGREQIEAIAGFTKEVSPTATTYVRLHFRGKTYPGKEK